VFSQCFWKFGGGHSPVAAQLRPNAQAKATTKTTLANSPTASLINERIVKPDTGVIAVSSDYFSRISFQVRVEPTIVENIGPSASFRFCWNQAVDVTEWKKHYLHSRNVFAWWGYLSKLPRTRIDSSTCQLRERYQGSDPMSTCSSKAKELTIFFKNQTK